MKKLIYCVLAFAAGLFASSCQQENLEPVAQEGTVTYTIEVPEVVTKAIADGKNVDRLFYEVYLTTSENQKDLFTGANLLYKKNVAMESVTGPTARTSVTLNLVQNQYYTVLFWAQCGEATEGLYDVDDLRAVTYREGVDIKSNHEDYAAFYAVDCISDATPRAKTVYLKRPFAQLNIGTLNTVDYSEDPYTVTMKQSKVTVKQVPTVFNVATSAVDGATDLTFTWESLELINDEQLVVNDKNYDYIAMNYMFAGENRTAKVEYELEAVMTTQGEVEVPADLAKSVVNVPLKENYRTNIVGNLLTNATQYEVIVDADWAGADLAPEALYLAAANGGEVTLTEDVVLENPLDIKADMALNLNGKTITGALNVAAGASVTIENGTIVNGDKTVSGITSNGILTLDNVVVESARHALRIESGSAVINGGIYEVAPVSASTLYALNVGDGANSIANVTVKGGTFIGPKNTMADSGGAVTVKVGSTVKIEGGDFSGGKTKTVSCDGEITIVGGSFDQNPDTYVAEGYKAVEKAGTWYVVAADVDNVVETKTELLNALNAAKNSGETNVVIDAAGAEINLEYGISSSNVPEGTTATIRNANVTGRSQWNYVDGTVIFENCSFTAGVYSIHFDGGKGNVIFKNCELVGWCPFAGTLNSVSFENCTLSGNGTYALIRSYANLALKDCTINISNANLTDEWPDGIEVVSPATLTEENVVYVVDNIETLQTVLDNATADIHVAFNNDLVGNATVSQNKTVVIDGKDKKFDGTIFVYGNSSEAEKPLTIKNVKFESDTVTDFIHSDAKALGLDNGKVRYANIYVEDCSFVGTATDAVAIRTREAYNITVKNCDATLDHSFLQAQSSRGITIENVKVTADRGFNLGNSNTTATFTNCEINATKADGYGIRFDQGNALNVTGCKITAYEPIVFRACTSACQFNLSSSELNPTGDYHVVVASGSNPSMDGVTGLNVKTL